jgi:hypothetical protein
MYFKLSKPKQATFVISLIVAVVALLLFLTRSDIADLNLFWVMAIAYLILALGNLVKGL